MYARTLQSNNPSTKMRHSKGLTFLFAVVFFPFKLVIKLLLLLFAALLIAIGVIVSLVTGIFNLAGTIFLYLIALFFVISFITNTFPPLDITLVFLSFMVVIVLSIMFVGFIPNLLNSIIEFLRDLSEDIQLFPLNNTDDEGEY